MQKIMVCIKRVVDYNVRVRVKPDGSGVMLDGVKMSLNPFDEIALEEALRIKERVSNIEVLAVSIGVADTQQQLRTALAMGADRAILVQTDTAVEPLIAAQSFLALVKKENPDLVLLGKQAIDDDANQTGQMLAAIWEGRRPPMPRKWRSRAPPCRSPARWTRASRPSRWICRRSSRWTCGSTSRAT